MTNQDQTRGLGTDLPPNPRDGISKVSTGILGFDEISLGGIPKGRLTLVTGGPGAGKTLFGCHTLSHRARAFDEPALFVAFEEPVERIRENTRAFEWGSMLEDGGRITLIEATLSLQTVQAGSFDLHALLAALSATKAETGAKNIVFDGVDALLSGLSDEQLERVELTRIRNWAADEGMTALCTVKQFISVERDQRRADFLSYLTDCAVSLEATLHGTTLSRTARIVKYRGSAFIGSESPLIIDKVGLNVIAHTAARLNYPTFRERFSTGVEGLNAIIGGGYLRGSSILISGAPGTAKTSLASSFIAEACRSNRKCLFVSFDESDAQIVANMQSIGIDLQPYRESGLLIMASLRSGSQGADEHFLTIRGLLHDHGAECLAIDPVSALLKAPHPFASQITENLLDYAKSCGVTTICTSLLSQWSDDLESSASNVSTIADTWLHVSYLAHNGERSRALTIVKSRGTSQSSQVRELVLSDHGIELVDVYASEGAVLMGAARAQREEMDREKIRQAEQDFKRKRFELEKTISELGYRAAEASRTLEWKRREAELFGDTEKMRIEAATHASSERIKFRVKDDVTPPDGNEF
jgi:circadian clock protein KaiC